MVRAVLVLVIATSIPTDQPTNNIHIIITTTVALLITPTNTTTTDHQVEPGCKVVAPCRCRGTAKWMWFADMNRRRRRDPVASRTCGTCHAVIDYGAYQKFGCVC